LCSLSLCAIVLQSSPPSHVSTSNGQRSLQLFCVRCTLSTCGEKGGTGDANDVTSHYRACDSLLAFRLNISPAKQFANTVPPMECSSLSNIAGPHNSRLVPRNVYPRDETLTQLGPHSHIVCVRLLLSCYGTFQK